MPTMSSTALRSMRKAKHTAAARPGSPPGPTPDGGPGRPRRAGRAWGWPPPARPPALADITLAARPGLVVLALLLLGLSALLAGHGLGPRPTPAGNDLLAA